MVIKQIGSLLRIVRIQNLLIMVAAQFLVRYCLILPAYRIEYIYSGEYPEHLSLFYFLLLVLSTILIAAGGYIINDFFDTETDAHNKPGKNLVGSFISEKNANLLSKLFSFTGIILGFIVAYKTGKIVMGFIQVFSAVSLYMYSSFYQKRILSGNFLISLLSALSLMIIGLYEPNYYPNFTYLFYYSAFAFLTTFAREIIKDMEDSEGDRKANYRTLPVVIGNKKSKLFVYFFILSAISLIGYIVYKDFNNNSVVNTWYLIGMFAIPFSALFYLVLKAEEKADFHFAGLFSKFIMIFGLATMYGLWYYFMR